MNDRPEWFAPKRFGYGSGLPIAWQGWLALGVYVAAIALASTLLATSPVALFGVIIPMTAILILIAARTTRGGWRWRWGDGD